MQLLSGRNRWFQAIVLTTSQAPTPKGELLSLFQIQELKVSQLRLLWGKLRQSHSPSAALCPLLLCLALPKGLCLPKAPKAAPAAICPPQEQPGLREGRAGQACNSSEATQSSQCLSTNPKPLLRPKPGVSASQNSQAQGAVLGIPAPRSLCHGGHSAQPSLHVLEFLQNTQNLPSPSSCTSPATGNNQPVQSQPKIQTLLKAGTC